MMSRKTPILKHVVFGKIRPGQPPTRAPRALLAALTCILQLSFFTLNSFAANEVAQTFTFQGRLLNQAGTSALLDTVTLTLGIYAPSGSCLLYQETKAGINLSLTDGLFAVSVGSFQGDPKRAVNDPNLTMSKVFGNLSVPTRADDSGTTNTCPGGYTPGAGDSRLLRVTVQDTTLGTAPVTLSPDQVINAAPQAVTAQSLQGYGPGNFIFSTGNVTQSNAATLTGGTDIGSTLHHHDSLYLQKGGSSAQNLGSGISYSTGQVGIGTSSPGGILEVDTGSATSIGQIIKGAAAQSADLLDFKSSTGTLLMKVDSGGYLTLKGDPTTGLQACTKNYVDNQILAAQPSIGVTTALAFGSGTSNLQGGIILAPYGTAAGNTGEIRFSELAANGSTYVGFKAPDSIASSKIWTLPIADGAANACLSTNGSGALSWRSAFGTVTNVTTSGPLNVSSGMTTPALSITQADATHDGFISSVDWNAFSAKQGSLGYAPVNKTGDTMSGQLKMNTATTADALAQILLATGVATNKGLVLQASSSQSANLFEVQNSAGTVLHKIDNLGYETLFGDPTANLGATTKQYVDSAVSTAGGAYLKKDGTVAFTGNQSLGGFNLTSVGSVATGSATTSLQGGIVLAPYGAGAGNTGEVRFKELAANGSTYVGFRAPDSVASSKIWTLPAADGGLGNVLTTNGSGALSWTLPSVGSVTNVTTSLPLSSSGGTTPNLSIATANTTTTGAISAADWNTFNGKESAITAGTTAQYFRGDKTWSSLATDVRALLSGTSPVSYSSATGAISLGTVPVANGGTNLTSLGTGNQILGVNNGATAMEYKSISGTTNQVTVTQGAGSITLSGPQDLATTSSPTFVGLTLTALNSSTKIGIGASTVTNKCQVNDYTTADSLAQLMVSTGATTNKGIVVQGIASQTANLQEWQNSAGIALAQVTSAGNLSSPRNVTSEVFGLGASSGAGTSVVIGNGATVTAGGGTAVGYAATANGGASTAVGSYATSPSQYGVAIGSGATAGGGGNTGNIAIGLNTVANGYRALALGLGSNTSHTYSIALGTSATTTASNQMVVGGTGSDINSAFFGNGVTTAAPASVTLNASGGSGTDITGASFNLAGGKGTGAGLGGSINFQTAPAGATGSVLGTLATRMTINSAGNVGIGTSSPSALFSIGSANNLTVDGSGNLASAGNVGGYSVSFNGSLYGPTWRSAGTNSVITIQAGGAYNGTGNSQATTIGGTFNVKSAGQFANLAVQQTYNQTGTAANTDLLINRTETAVGSGAQLLIDAQVGGTSKFNVSNNGTVSLNTGVIDNSAGGSIFLKSFGATVAEFRNTGITLSKGMLSNITPALANNVSLGSTSLRWQKIWATDIDSTNAPVTSSDRRLKKEIKDTALGLDFINQLRPVSYRWRNPANDQRPHYGLIAQELEEALGGKDRGIVKYSETEDRYSVAYTELIAPLIKAVQELFQKTAALISTTEVHSREIASLKEQASTLAIENAALKALVCQDHPAAEACRK